MQSCSGAAVVMGSLQQPIWIKGSAFPCKGFGISGNQNYVKLISVGACRASQLGGSLVTGRPPSSVSVPVPEIGGNGYESTDCDYIPICSSKSKLLNFCRFYSE